jgi:hypothetical protein
MKKLLISIFLFFGAVSGCELDATASKPLYQPVQQVEQKNEAYDMILEFPADRYPETADHIRDAIAAGHSAICTIDRDGADKRRRDSLKDYPPKKGYDRDEYPMAMCQEGGAGADIRYIDPSDNRGAGAWVSNQLEDEPDGTKVKFVVQ